MKILDENYEIYEDGRLYSYKTNKFLKFASIGRNGYSAYRLYAHKESKYYSAHRLVAEAFVPNPENLSQVNHIDGNPRNNHYTNLEWCTPSQNIRCT